MAAMTRRAALALPALAFAAPARAAPMLVGAYLGPDCRGLERVPAYEAWLGRRIDACVDFLDRSAWDKIEASLRWLLHCRRAQSRRLVLSLPMVPHGVPLAEGASGQHDARYRTVGELLVSRGHPDAIIRIGWEFNGNWYPWASFRDPPAFIACWRRMAQILRGVPGQRFTLDWNANAGRGAMRADEAYPGDDVVDVIGLDAYNQSYPREEDPERRWRFMMEQPFGLAWHRDFAAAHRKPRSFPEWATGTSRDGHGGGDDPLYVRRMLDWMRTGPTVLYMGYWEYNDPLYDGRLGTGLRPQAAEAFRAGLRG